MQRMNALDAALGAVHMQSPMREINLRPPKLTKLLRTQAMPIRQQDRRTIPGSVPPSLARSFDQPINLLLS
jgi:hypothetical protein